MKNIFAIILILILNISLAQNNETTCFIYKKISTENPDVVKSERVKSVLKSMPQTEYHLIVNDSISIFKIKDKVYTDDFNKGAISHGGGSTIYSFLNDTILTSYRELNIFGEDYLVNNEKAKVWVVSNESKLINNFKCYKANSSKNVAYYKIEKETGKFIKNIVSVDLEAWFCPDFPYSFGPDDFYGLPGIVFEGYQINGKVIFALNSIDTVSNIKIDALPKRKIISEDKVFEIMSEKMNSNSKNN